MLTFKFFVVSMLPETRPVTKEFKMPKTHDRLHGHKDQPHISIGKTGPRKRVHGVYIAWAC